MITIKTRGHSGSTPNKSHGLARFGPLLTRIEPGLLFAATLPVTSQRRTDVFALDCVPLDQNNSCATRAVTGSERSRSQLYSFPPARPLFPQCFRDFPRARDLKSQTLKEQTVSQLLGSSGKILCSRHPLHPVIPAS